MAGTLPNVGWGGGAVSIPGWGTGSHMPQLRVHILQLRSGTAKINKKKKELTSINLEILLFDNLS